jgi:hypothetical protein
MESLTIIVLSPDTIDAIIEELDAMLHYGDLEESQCEEIGRLIHGLQESDEIRLQLTT